jgi:hypothetical protein
MTAHTPGPWWFAATTGSGFDSPDGSCYAAGVGDHEVTLPLSKSDARLVAAAPDLLEACKAMVASNMGHPRGVTVPALDAMRAAILKATGTEDQA